MSSSSRNGLLAGSALLVIGGAVLFFYPKFSGRPASRHLQTASIALGVLGVVGSLVAAWKFSAGGDTAASHKDLTNLSQATLRELREACRRTYARCTAFANVDATELAFGDEIKRAFNLKEVAMLEVGGERWVLIPAFERADAGEAWRPCFLAGYWDERWRPSAFCFPTAQEKAKRFIAELQRRTSAGARLESRGPRRKTSRSDSLPVADDPMLSLLPEVEKTRRGR